MRKLSFKWPIWLTLIGFSQPLFYLLFSLQRHVFNVTEFILKLTGAIGIIAVVWFIYGVMCLCMPTKIKNNP